jgi:hypothetical protein
MCFKIRSALNKGNFGNLQNIALTDFVKLRTIQNNSNNGNNRNIDLTLDFFKIRSAGTKVT